MGMFVYLMKDCNDVPPIHLFSGRRIVKIVRRKLGGLMIWVFISAQVEETGFYLILFIAVSDGPSSVSWRDLI